MKRIYNGKTYTIEPGLYPSGNGKRVRGHAVYSAGKKENRHYIGVAYRKADGWYCRGAGCDVEHFGGGLMRDAISSMIRKQR